MESPCPWDEETCAMAALNGHLEIIKWARSREPPCPWDEDTCAMAALNAQMAVIKWAHENG